MGSLHHVRKIGTIHRRWPWHRHWQYSNVVQLVRLLTASMLFVIPCWSGADARQLREGAAGQLIVQFATRAATGAQTLHET